MDDAQEFMDDAQEFMDDAQEFMDDAQEFMNDAQELMDDAQEFMHGLETLALRKTILVGRPQPAEWGARLTFPTRGQSRCLAIIDTEPFLPVDAVQLKLMDLTMRPVVTKPYV
ncbi:hypothetical protein GNI_183930 [Gregarina niphandrodes]|uniref:Uncharacterized protein n=1 Tax=Gregarina niphandrodes TaxID=110365 RepID=A0A023AXI2_GRENI|nr:hypothetical protein GNI_183930 [Gregarina niphandrodes]EZG43178.1 hypothetical protein GNI_183930 [Gregarina niphandrodes]|eukprot:XP_011133565.1 hypothetical protein GNI_183930 [Gregarina niphandrodes]